MTKKIIRTILYPVLVIGITVSLFSVAYAATNSNIDPQAKWAWSANTGWINFNPPNGGVTVCDDHLEGYAWGENAGWINFNSSGPVSYKVSMLLYRIYLSLVIKGS